MNCDYELSTEEGFEFDGRHTSEFGLVLLERIADPPDEKEIKENIPFMQGDLDFSNILGQRVYNDRSLTFRMLIVDYDYDRRKIIEKSLTNWLMRPGKTRLYDSFSEGYYYVVKCVGINYVDSYQGMTAEIHFEGYPFMIGEYLEGNDLWDPFNFELDVFQETKFNVNGSKTVILYNNGSSMVPPKIIASAPFELVAGSQRIKVPAGTSESKEFMLNIGENKIKIIGNGSIEFQFYKELL